MVVVADTGNAKGTLNIATVVVDKHVPAPSVKQERENASVNDVKPKAIAWRVVVTVPFVFDSATGTLPASGCVCSVPCVTVPVYMAFTPLYVPEEKMLLAELRAEPMSPVPFVLKK